MTRPQNPTALVTGGNRGIGRAIAAGLQAQGCAVTLGARDEDQGRRAADEIGCSYVRLDLEDPDTGFELYAGAGGFERAYVTITQGIRAVGEDAPEQVAARFAEISDRSGEIVPEMGAAQGMIELTKAQAAHQG